MAPVFEMWADGKVRESLAASEDVRERIAHLPQDVREHVTALRALHSISLGRAAEALVIADAIARAALPPTDLPIGIITALLGSPVFIWLLWGRRQHAA